MKEEHLFIVVILMLSYKLLSYIVDVIIKKWDDKKYQDKINYRMAMTDRLNKYIGLLTDGKYNGYILEFHNGCHNLSGVPFLKQSITMEDVRSIKFSLINMVRDFYITPELYQKLRTENHIIKSTVSEFAKITPTIGRLMDNEGDFDLWLVPIKKKSVILGCIILVGNEETMKLEDVNESIIELIKEDYINQK